MAFIMQSFTVSAIVPDTEAGLGEWKELRDRLREVALPSTENSAGLPRMTVSISEELSDPLPESRRRDLGMAL